MNVFVGICVDDISNKILHAMCVNGGLSISYIEGRAIHEKRGGVIAIDRVEERIKWVGARSMKRAIEIVCVCKSKI